MTRSFLPAGFLAGGLLAFLIGCPAGSGAGDPPAAIVEFTVPVPLSWPDDIAGDAAGNVWFAMQSANQIGRMAPDGTFSTFPIPTPNSQMDSLVVDTARAVVWGTQLAGNHVVRLDPATGHVVELPLPMPDVSPGDVALGPDGTLWFVEGYEANAHGKGRLGKVDPVSNAITEIPFPSLRDGLDGILVDTSGVVWIAEFENSRVARYSAGVFTEFDLPHSGSYPTNLAMDHAGRLWITEEGANTLTLFEPNSGSWTDYAIPTRNSSPAGVAVDAAGNVWFTETAGNRIGVLAAGTSRILEFPIPTAAAYPEDIRPIGGRIYFSERFGNKIAWISVPGITS